MSEFLARWRRVRAACALRRSFRPTPEIRASRTVWRERAECVQQAGVCIQRMRKALPERNMQLTTVLSDLKGVRGRKIPRAIVAGVRDGNKLAEFRDKAVKASQETIAKSLEGTWLSEQMAEPDAIGRPGPAIGAASRGGPAREEEKEEGLAEEAIGESSAIRSEEGTYADGWCESDPYRRGEDDADSDDDE